MNSHSSIESSSQILIVAVYDRPCLVDSRKMGAHRAPPTDRPMDDVGLDYLNGPKT
jgi:hypothetical protein